MPPISPPTGPDIKRFTGFSCADCNVVAPPEDCIRCRSALIPFVLRDSLIVPRYFDVLGPTYAFNAVVENLSYSLY